MVERAEAHVDGLSLVSFRSRRVYDAHCQRSRCVIDVQRHGMLTVQHMSEMAGGIRGIADADLR